MTRARRRRAQRGYTLIEVMASLAVLASGLMGIIALQGSTAMANQRAQELTTATNLARRWQERLRRDALHWSAPSQQSSITNIQLTWYLRDLLSQPTTNWVVPVQPSGLTATPEFAGADYWGNDVAVTAPQLYYCTHVRLTRLVANELVRSEVRVWWYRRGAERLGDYANCGATSVLQTMGRDTTNLRWVYLTQTLARHEQ